MIPNYTRSIYQHNAFMKDNAAAIFAQDFKVFC